MNQDDPRQRRRWGAFAGLSAAAGAALAAAMIPAAPAFAEPADDAVGASAVGGGSELQALDKLVIYDAGGNGATANFDEAAINAALSDFPGGLKGADAIGEETFLVDHPPDLSLLVSLDTSFFDAGADNTASGPLAVADVDFLAFFALPVEQILTAP